MDYSKNSAGWLLLLFLAIPLIAFVAASGIEWHLDATLREALTKAFPERTAEISKITASSLCTKQSIRTADPAFVEICNLSDNMGLMKWGSIIAATVGIALLLAIKIAGTVSRGSRTLLLLLFAPGLHLTMLTLSALMILHAALAISAIYYGESALIGRIHVGIIFGLGIGALFGVFAMIRAQFSTFTKATTTVLGNTLESGRHPKIWKFVSELANTMGAQRPDAIVAGLEPNFYVTEANIVCLDGKLKGRTMYVSIPLCRILGLDEMRAVLGHELGHYKGLDTRFSRRFYPIYRGATQGLLNIASGFSEKGGVSEAILLPAFATMAYFLNSFSESEKKISRERELAADNEAARADGARNLAIALVKVHAFSSAWLVIVEGMKQALGEGKVFINASSLFADIVGKMEKNEALGSVSEEGPVHPTDTHPPLSERLKNLGLTLEDVIKDASNTLPKNPAVNLLNDVEELEKKLTEVEHAVLIRKGEAQIGGEEQPTGESGEVATSKRCPACATSNPTGAAQCQCGYNFLRQG